MLWLEPELKSSGLGVLSILHPQLTRKRREGVGEEILMSVPRKGDGWMEGMILAWMLAISIARRCLIAKVIDSPSILVKAGFSLEVAEEGLNTFCQDAPTHPP